MSADVVIFGVLLADAGQDWPGRNRLLEELALRHPVVFLQRGAGRDRFLRGVTLAPSRSHPQVQVADNALTWSENRWTRRLGRMSAWVDHRRLRRELVRRGWTRPLLWATTPQPFVMLGTPHVVSLYDCMDPCFEPQHQQRFDRDEAWMVARSDMVFASAHSLQRRMQRLHRDVVLLPNAADEDDIARAASPTERVVGERPRVGYLGTIDWRFDGDLVADVAEAMPDVDFVLGGRVNKPEAAYVDRLRSIPNVSLLGQIAIGEGRDLVQSLDVGIVPFVPGEMNDAVNPVKLFMYLAYGKPVVATDIEECRRSPFVRVGADVGQFANSIRGALVTTTDVEERRAYAAANSWAERARTAEKELSIRGVLD